MIDASPETPAALMYIQENRKKGDELIENMSGAIGRWDSEAFCKETEQVWDHPRGRPLLPTSGAVPFWTFVCQVSELPSRANKLYFTAVLFKPPIGEKKSIYNQILI